MIKRVHYKQDHGDRSGSSSDSSSSDSGTESDASARPEQEEQVSESESESGGEEAVAVERNLESDDEDEEEEENEQVEEEEFYQKKPSLHSPGSGYESEKSSGNEVDEDSPGLGADMEEEKETKLPRVEADNAKEKHKKGGIGKADNAKENSTGIEELDSCILKCKSVFRCKLCPRIICLSEKIVKQHLESKRHARSKKLFEEGRLKVKLNSDGELEEDYETHAERYARTLALAEEGPRVSKKDTGRQRQSQRRKKRSKNAATEKAEQHTGSSKKKKQKSEK